MHFEHIDPWLYSVIMAVSLVAGYGTLKWLNYPRSEHGIPVKYLLPVIIIGAAIGAKLPVLFSYGFQLALLWTGKSYFGAIVGAMIGLNVFKRACGISGYFGDRFVIPLCVSAAIGKMGCLIYGCCGGIPTDGALYVTNQMGHPVVPVQLYEMVFQLGCVALFVALHRRSRFKGSLFLWYLALYGVFRFGIEFVRTEPRIGFGLTMYQWMALVIVPVSAGLIRKRMKHV